MGEDRLERRPEARAFSVETLLQLVAEGRIRIPEFQRPLRWRARHIVDLLDSVYRGFPVGDLLFFKRPAEAATVYVGPLAIRAPAVPDAYFVVDGQQRITALAGAMLHTGQPWESYMVWFDLVDERFVSSGGVPPPHWIPLNVVGDSFALLNWLNAWPFRAERPDLVQRAIALGKALREYQIPAYIVEGASERVLRLIFKRVNDSGVRMQETEIFTALFSAGEPQPIARACARLHAATGLGRIPLDSFLQCLKIVAGLSPTQRVTEAQVDKLDPQAIERTEAALLRAIRFLRNDAAIPHLRLFPLRPAFLILARFFDLHPQPSPRTRVLLSRWLWRALIDPFQDQPDFDLAEQTARVLGADEIASVERLLDEHRAEDGAEVEPFFPSSSEWAGSPLGHVCALALAALGPRDPETGDVLDGDALRALLDTRNLGEILCDVEGQPDSAMARRVFVSSLDKVEKLASAPLPVLESHCLDQEAADALARGDIDTFVARRTPLLDAWLQRFFSARTDGDDGDRPPIAELIRRADAVLVAP